MSVLLQMKGLGYTLGTKTLFRDLDLSINRGDRIGLVGHNGAGKSSLLKLAANSAQPDEGEVIRTRNLQLASVEQFVPEHLRNKPLLDAVLQILPEEEQEPWRAETILQALGFTPVQLSVPLARLSGGQQNIALLARARLIEPDVMLMDEPGNHMDVTALAALRQFLLSDPKMTYVMVSHDRDLLDDCCTHTLFLRDQRTYSFRMTYSQAKQALQQQDEQAAERRKAEEKEIDRIRRSAKRLAQWGKDYDNEDLARKAKTMAARAEKLEEAKTFVSKGSGLELSVASSHMRTKTVFTLEEFVVSALDDQRVLLRCEHLVAKPGDRIALLGTNGSGKSTTIKRLLSQEADPSVRYNPNTQLGYVDQELEAFDNPASRYDWLAQRTKASEGEIKRVLLQAGIAWEDFGQCVTTLSGGEKARMMFMTLRLAQPNFIILDEPTNHIDLDSREELEEQLQHSGATLLITSHDRRFLSQVCDRFWLIYEGRLAEVDSLDDYYNQIIGWDDNVSNDTSPAPTATPADSATRDEDAMLARVDELEQLLKADEARKPKFQKPERQKEWRAELAALWQALEAQQS